MSVISVAATLLTLLLDGQQLVQDDFHLACYDGEYGDRFYPTDNFGPRMTADPPDARVTDAWAICEGCLNHASFGDDNSNFHYCDTYSASTGRAYRLLEEHGVSGQNLYVHYYSRDPVPADAYIGCLNNVYFQRDAGTRAGQSFEVEFQMFNRLRRGPAGASNQAVDNITVTNTDCFNNPVEFESALQPNFALTPSVWRLNVPCPANLSDLLFPVPFAFNYSDEYNLPCEFPHFYGAVMEILPHTNLYDFHQLFELHPVNTTNATWSNARRQLDPGWDWTFKRECTATYTGDLPPGQEPYRVTLCAEVFANVIYFTSCGPSWAFEQCMQAVDVALNPLAPYNTTLPSENTTTLRRIFDVGYDYNENVENYLQVDTQIDLRYLICDASSPLIPRILNNAWNVPFGYGCLRKGAVHLNQLWRPNVNGLHDPITALTFTCVDCVDQGLIPSFKPTSFFHNVSFWDVQPDASFAICLASPTSMPILIERYLNESTGTWTITMRPDAYLDPLPTAADYWACSHGVLINYGSGEPTIAGIHTINVAAYIGALINPYVVRSNITINFCPEQCEICLRELHPYSIPGFFGDWPLRSFEFAPAPYPLPSSQAPTPFIPAVPLVEFGVHLNPDCPICGFRIAFAPGDQVWAQDVLVCPTGLPSFIWCNWNAQQGVLQVRINPVNWDVHTPELIEWLLAHVRYVNSAALHVQGVRSFTVAFLQCGVPLPSGWYFNQTFSSVALVTRDIPGQPVCPRLRTGSTAATAETSIGPFTVEPLVLLEGGGNSESAFIVGASVVITNCIPHEDVLDVDPSTLASLPGLRWAWIPDGCKITFEGGRPFADYARLLRAVRYSNSRGAQATEGTRVIDMFVWTPRCASRFWKSYITVVADCPNRCTCTPRFDLTFTPSFGADVDAWSQVYYRRDVAVNLVEVQAPLPLGTTSNSRVLHPNFYCQHPPAEGGLVVRATVCIWRGYEYGVDSIYYQGQSEDMWYDFLSRVHVATYEPPAVLATGSGFNFETGCITFVVTPPETSDASSHAVLAPQLSAPSSVFIEAISRLTFILGNNETLGHDRLIRADFETDAGVGGGVCHPPPVEVLLQVRNNQTRLFAFNRLATPLPPRPSPTPVPNNTVSIIGLFVEDYCDFNNEQTPCCPIIYNLIDGQYYYVFFNNRCVWLPSYNYIVIYGNITRESFCADGEYPTIVASSYRILGSQLYFYDPFAPFDYYGEPLTYTNSPYAYDVFGLAQKALSQASSAQVALQPADGPGTQPQLVSSSWAWPTN